MSDAEQPFIDKTLVEPIVLDDAQGRWQFDPQPDITAYEAALISQLFTAMVLRHKRLDWREYLTRNRFPVVAVRGANGEGLPRHFKDFQS